MAQIDFQRLEGGMGGRAQRLPPKERRKNIVLALLRFVSLLFLCALLLFFFRRELLEMSWKQMVEIG